MSKFIKAVEDVQKFQNMFGGILELAEALKEIPSIEGHIEELKSKREGLIRSIEQSQEMLAFESDKYLKVRDQNEQQLKDAKAEHDKIVGEAVEQAVNIQNAALEKAKALDDDMKLAHEEFLKNKEENEKILTSLKLEVESEYSRLQSIQKEIERIKSL